MVRLFYLLNLYSKCISLQLLMNNICREIEKETNVNNEFIVKFLPYLMNPLMMILFDDVKDLVGYKQKRSVSDILYNDKYGFIEGCDFKIEKNKKKHACKPINDIYLTIDTLKCICLISPSEESNNFRKCFIKIEKAYDLNKQKFTKSYFDINKHTNKEVLYLIFIKNDIYKFGITNDIRKRLMNHAKFLKYQYVIKCWDSTNRTVSKKIEDNIKRYIKVNKFNHQYEGQTEIIKTNDIDKLIKVFDVYVSNEITEYNDIFRNKELEQKIILAEKMIELHKLQAIELDKHVEIINGLHNMKGNNITIYLNDIFKSNNNIQINQDVVIFENNNDKLQLDKKIIKEIDDIELIIRKCRHCSKNKKQEDFGWDSVNVSYFKQCIECRNRCRMLDKEKRDKKIIIDNNELKFTQELDVDEKKYIQRNREYYKKNSSEIIDHKKRYMVNRINNITDPNKAYCKKCNTIKNNEEFGINIKINQQYKQCSMCRSKQTIVVV